MPTYRRLLLIVVLSMSLQPALAETIHDRSSLNDAETDYIRARQAEAQGSYDAAEIGYTNCLDNAMRSTNNKAEWQTMKVSGEPLVAIGRRAIAMRKKIFNSNPGDKTLLKQQKNPLEHLYCCMMNLEPNNASWYYLNGALLVSEQDFVHGRRYLRACVQCTGGSTQVKQKATTLLAHIKKAADIQEKWLMEDLAKSREWFARVMAAPYHSTYEPSKPVPDNNGSSGSTIPEYEQYARRAEDKGDYGAAERFRNGSNTWADEQRNW